jgi:hypothetical protein
MRLQVSYWDQGSVENNLSSYTKIIVCNAISLIVIKNRNWCTTKYTNLDVGNLAKRCDFCSFGMLTHSDIIGNPHLMTLRILATHQWRVIGEWSAVCYRRCPSDKTQNFPSHIQYLKSLITVCLSFLFCLLYHCLFFDLQFLIIF